MRTLYRDIATLQAQGADIQGEAGVGFVLRPGFMLPPLMFSEEEIEALVLGVRWVASRADPQLGLAARSLLAKIVAVLPEELRGGVDASALLVAPSALSTDGNVDLAAIRKGIKSQRKLLIHYRDGKEQVTTRIIWPFALGYFDAARVIAAWCETRNDFRHFRCDRIEAWEILPDKYAQSRASLLKRWREKEAISMGSV